MIAPAGRRGSRALAPCRARGTVTVRWFLAAVVVGGLGPMANAASLGEEVSVPRHLAGPAAGVPLPELLRHGERLFSAAWTSQEGGGRPLMNGAGHPMVDPAAPLVFPRNFNRISGPDANACTGCHNSPFGLAGGGGDFVSNVFLLGERFDFVTFDIFDTVPNRGSMDELARAVDMQTIANTRSPPGLFGAGFIEMLARQISADLQAIRDELKPGHSRTLSSKGISFGILSRRLDGTWDTSRVEGLAPASLASSLSRPPSLLIRPFHQHGAAVSLREFTNTAFNRHHGIQSAERFGGPEADPDGDGFADELTTADVTAVVLFQAGLPVPGQVIPNDTEVETAVQNGALLFEHIGCSDCHRPRLPLDRGGWVFTEPGPYNPAGNLGVEDEPVVSLDMTSAWLPGPRLKVERGVVWVPAFTDLKLHDITAGPDDPNREPLNPHAPPGSPEFFAGNSLFLTRKLWGTGNEPPYSHHGRHTTLRESVLAHAGEAYSQRAAFEALDAYGQASVIEFLKTLQVLPPGARALVVDERGQPKLRWGAPGGG